MLEINELTRYRRDNLDMSDPSKRSRMNRDLSDRKNALDSRLWALLEAPFNGYCIAKNWTIHLEDCNYAYESARDVNREYLRDQNTTVEEPYEFKNYFRIIYLWKNMQRAGVGLWDGPDDEIWDDPDRG